MHKILIIRMLELGDVASIGVPALRHIKQQNVDSKLYCLTHGKGVEIISLAEPEVQILTLPENHWPDNILQAMEVFLGAAETIVGIEFDLIINLDTAFMPCFLARFLKDAGEPVAGNIVSESIQTIFQQIQQQTLSADYVNDQRNYLQSTYNTMYKWHTDWWKGENIVDGGFSEFYLKHCCGFANIAMDMQINVPAINQSSDTYKAMICLATSGLQWPEFNSDELISSLQDIGYKVCIDSEKDTVLTRLSKIKSSDLVVCAPNAAFAFASSQETPTLLISGELDPRFLMPDYATEFSLDMPKPSELLESIDSIFNQDPDEQIISTGMADE